MLLFLAGGKTEPIQTLLFMQASIPVSACISSLVYGTRSVPLIFIAAHTAWLALCELIVLSLLW